MLSSKKSTFTNIFSKERTFTVGILLIGLVFLIVLSAVYFFQNREATLLLAFENNGNGRMFAGKVVGNMTILNALDVASKAGQIELKYSVSADGEVIINGLDGYDTSLSDKKMVFYLNGKRIEVEQINFVRIKPGDNIEVRLE